MTEKQYIITEAQMNILTTTLKDIYKTNKKRKKPEPKTDEGDWVCSGRIWEDPVGPCIPGERSNTKMKILYNRKRHIVCKECKLARDRSKKPKKIKKTENE